MNNTKNKKIKRFIGNPLLLLLYIIRRMKHLIPDHAFITLSYYVIFKKKLRLENPQTYNEKIQWLKLYDHQPTYTNLVDKLSAKEIIGKLIGHNHIIKTIDYWDNFDDIDFDTLPEQFVLKTTHDSGTVIICKDKSKFDIVNARRIIDKSLKKNYYWEWREWPYKNIEPRIMAEEYMVDESGVGLKDYKFFCFDGVPKFMFIASDRGIDTRFDFFDTDFNHLPFINGYKNSNKKISKPYGFEKMIELSKIISKNYKHVRVDFYDINGEIYFGEFTLYHWSGLVPFEPEEWDYKLGELIKLPI